jgi:hypothetical protein
MFDLSTFSFLVTKGLFVSDCALKPCKYYLLGSFTHLFGVSFTIKPSLRIFARLGSLRHFMFLFIL